MSFKISFNAYKRPLDPTDKLGCIWLKIRDRLYDYGVQTVQLLGEVESKRGELALCRRSVQGEAAQAQALVRANASYRSEAETLESRIAEGKDTAQNQKLLDWRTDKITENDVAVESFARHREVLAALEEELAPLEAALRERSDVEAKITAIFSNVYGMPAENLAAVGHTFETLILIPDVHKNRFFEFETDEFLDAVAFAFETDEFFDAVPKTDRFWGDPLDRMPDEESDSSVAVASSGRGRSHSFELTKPSKKEGRARSESLGDEHLLHGVGSSPPSSDPDDKGKGKRPVGSDDKEYVSSEEDISSEDKELDQALLASAEEARKRPLHLEGGAAAASSSSSSSSCASAASSSSSSSAAGKTPLGPVSVAEMFGSPELQARVGQVIPLDQVTAVKRTAADTYEVTFKGALKGELDWGNDDDRFLVEAEALIRGLLQPFEAKAKKALEAPDKEEDGAVKKTMKAAIRATGLTLVSIPQYKYLTRAWEGLNESHWKLSKTIKVQVKEGRFTILNGGFRFGLHVKDLAKVLWNSVHQLIYYAAVPILVKKGIFKTTYRGNWTVKPVQLTFSVSGISKEGITVMRNLTEPIPFEHDATWQEPITWKSLKGKTPRLSAKGGLKIHLPEEGFAFISQYLKFCL